MSAFPRGCRAEGSGMVYWAGIRLSEDKFVRIALTTNYLAYWNPNIGAFVDYGYDGIINKKKVDESWQVLIEGKWFRRIAAPDGQGEWIERDGVPVEIILQENDFRLVGDVGGGD
jgi:hypothetical protein